MADNWIHFYTKPIFAEFCVVCTAVIIVLPPTTPIDLLLASVEKQMNREVNVLPYNMHK